MYWPCTHTLVHTCMHVPMHQLLLHFTSHFLDSEPISSWDKMYTESCRGIVHFLNKFSTSLSHITLAVPRTCVTSAENKLFLFNIILVINAISNCQGWFYDTSVLYTGLQSTRQYQNQAFLVYTVLYKPVYIIGWHDFVEEQIDIRKCADRYKFEHIQA